MGRSKRQDRAVVGLGRDFTRQLCSARCRSGESQRVGTTHGASRLPLVVLRYNRYGPVGEVHSAPTSSSVIFVKILVCFVVISCYKDTSSFVLHRLIYGNPKRRLLEF